MIFFQKHTDSADKERLCMFVFSLLLPRCQASLRNEALISMRCLPGYRTNKNDTSARPCHVVYSVNLLISVEELKSTHHFSMLSTQPEVKATGYITDGVCLKNHMLCDSFQKTTLLAARTARPNRWPTFSRSRPSAPCSPALLVPNALGTL